jgi:hypothetical protein
MNADSIQYALETDWPVGAGGLEPLHLRSEFTKTFSLADSCVYRELHPC